MGSSSRVALIGRVEGGPNAHTPQRSGPTVTLTRMSDEFDSNETSSASAQSSEPAPSDVAGSAESRTTSSSSAPSAKPAPVDRAYESAGALTIGVVLLVVGFALWTYGEHAYLATMTEYEISFFVLESGASAVPQRPDTVGWGIAIGILGLVLTTLGVYRLATHVDFLAQRAKNADAGSRYDV